MELKVFIDGTLGAGGHAKALLDPHPEIVRYIGIDQDTMAQQIAAQTLATHTDRVEMVHGNFADHIDSARADGILLDLGVSSMQLDLAERGFSFSKPGPLDMRMNRESPLTAQIICETYDEKALADLLHHFGEVRGSYRIAKAIVAARKEGPIDTTTRLYDIVRPLLKSHGKTDPVTTIFQALRIAVNDELGVLAALKKGMETLNPGGRMAVITFHSLEDRIVKQAFRKGATNYEIDPTDPYTGRRAITPLVKLITPKPIAPTRAEIEANPRARSSKLRIVERVS